MSRFRFRDEDSSSGATVATVLLGAVAGFAVGMYVAQRVGGIDGLTTKLRRRFTGEGGPGRRDLPGLEYDEIEEEDADAAISGNVADDLEDDFNGMDDDGIPLLEERVLEAFNNDPILSERAIDIGSIGRGVVELAGWVDDDDEAEHAMTVARGVPGVVTVVNRLMVDEEEEQINSTLKRFRDGDSSLSETRWEGQQVGTGKRRQGTSAERDRHADPKPKLEDRWLSESEAIRNAADELGESSSDTGSGRGRNRKATGGQPEAGS
ncbi:MAG TPA: BON domain-containing protein [Gemmatimonadaceae bacterium]|nr:BON domain-containing protein [Gemmatimonadaceae bacterium]